MCDETDSKSKTLHEKYPNMEFLWSVFSRIWAEYGDLRSKSPYSVRMRENTHQKTLYLDTFHAVKTQ